VEFKAGRDWVLEYATRDWTIVHDLAAADGDAGWSSDKELMLEVVQWWWEALEAASPLLKNDGDLFDACLRHHQDIGWRALALAGDKVRSDEDSVFEACAMDIRALELAAESVRGDKDFVLQLVSNDKEGLALKYASSALKADRDVVLAAVQCCGNALRFAAPGLRADRAVVLAAIRKSFHALVDVCNTLAAHARPQHLNARV
jgi:hypothetical protein